MASEPPFAEGEGARDVGRSARPRRKRRDRFDREQGRQERGAAVGLTVELSTQPGLQYTFWESELNGESDRGELLELAYAVTVHKSQGSQFKTTFVVVPDPACCCRRASLHGAHATAGQSDRVEAGRGIDASRARVAIAIETARRLTCLFRPADPFVIGDKTDRRRARAPHGPRRRSCAIEVKSDRGGCRSTISDSRTATRPN